MSLFKDAADILAHLDFCYHAFPWLQDILSTNTRNTWVAKLYALEQPEFFLNERLNLLNTAVMTGYSMVTGRDDYLFAHYRRLLQKLELYLEEFPALQEQKPFLKKITNLDGPSFLATMSELSLAYELKQRGYQVEFETKFRLPAYQERDIDLSVRTARGNRFYIEVYMPSELFEPASATDLEEAYPLHFLDLTQGDKSLALRIQKKLKAKFGRKGLDGLDGRVCLAVNTVFMDLFQLTTRLYPDSRSSRALVQLLPKGVDGLLLFADSFQAESSFRIDFILRKSVAALGNS